MDDFAYTDKCLYKSRLPAPIICGSGISMVCLYNKHRELYFTFMNK